MTNDAPVFAPALSPQEGAEAATTLFREVFEAEPDADTVDALQQAGTRLTVAA